MTQFTHQKVKEVFDNYPSGISEELLSLRQLIYDVAYEEKSIEQVQESLKWGEPSFVTKQGSPIRMDWKQSKPDQFAIYFNCKTKLVETFRELFSDRFTFEGNRAIIFNKEDLIDTDALKYCILLALTYHKRKHLSMLDI